MPISVIAINGVLIKLCLALIVDDFYNLWKNSEIVSSNMKLTAKETAVLTHLANKYIWWKTGDESLQMPKRVIAQVMNIGDYTDVQQMADQLGDAVLREVLMHAEAGQFNARSWFYWHYQLGLASVEQVPPMLIRKFE